MKTDKASFLASSASSLAELRRRYRFSIVRPLSSATCVEAIPTDIASLDLCLGIGGLPRGRLTEIFGPESSGKTTLALAAIANAQNLGHRGAFIDVEHALDTEYARRLGVDPERLLIVDPYSGDEAMQILIDLVEANEVSIAVIDSIAGLMSDSEATGPRRPDSELATLLSRYLPLLVRAASRSGASILLLNQIREKVGVLFGRPETTPGGRALRHYSSLRIEMRRLMTIKDNEQVVGTRIRATVAKSKVGPAWRCAELDFYYDRGPCRVSDIVHLASFNNLIAKYNGHFYFKDWKVGGSPEDVVNYFRTNVDALEVLRCNLEQIDKALPPQRESSPIWDSRCHRAALNAEQAALAAAKRAAEAANR